MVPKTSVVIKPSRMRYVWSYIGRFVFIVLSIMVVMTFNIMQGVGQVPKVLIWDYWFFKGDDFYRVKHVMVAIGVWVGQRPRVSACSTIIQFLASIPPNFLYPLFVSQIIIFQLNPSIWLSPLIVLGCQWYILFNVIMVLNVAKNLHQAAKMLKLSGWLKWKKLILPGLFPSIITGMMAAAGGAWNATVVVEVIGYGEQVVKAADWALILLMQVMMASS